MKCPKCGSVSGSHYEEWDEYWDGENEDTDLRQWWDCFDCQTRTNSYEEGFEYED